MREHRRGCRRGLPCAIHSPRLVLSDDVRRRPRPSRRRRRRTGGARCSRRSQAAAAGRGAARRASRRCPARTEPKHSVTKQGPARGSGRPPPHPADRVEANRGLEVLGREHGEQAHPGTLAFTAHVPTVHGLEFAYSLYPLPPGRYRPPLALGARRPDHADRAGWRLGRAEAGRALRLHAADHGHALFGLPTPPRDAASSRGEFLPGAVSGWRSGRSPRSSSRAR